ncbi:hypothetical protein DL96DRAFT_1068102 [Flagelloscypha sp. PMI_526]|nr:hypothetical protein DL96DRAFT_1068102 [Flagelloscypha sp. PMI_526]
MSFPHLQRGTPSPDPYQPPKPPESPDAHLSDTAQINELLTQQDVLPEESDQRPKRRQVKRACVHCRKACKRCDEKRPCTRCTRYGFANCVDAARKERKKGIKRGPYKKRDAKGSKPVEGPSQPVQQVFSSEPAGCRELPVSSPPPVSPQGTDLKKERYNYPLYRPSAPPPPSVSAARQRVEQGKFPVPGHLAQHYYAVQQQPNYARQIARYEPSSPVSPDGSQYSPTLASPVSPVTPGDRDGYNGVPSPYSGYNYRHHAEAMLVQTYSSPGYSSYHEYPCYVPEPRLYYHYASHPDSKDRPGPSLHAQGSY